MDSVSVAAGKASFDFQGYGWGVTSGVHSNDYLAEHIPCHCLAELCVVKAFLSDAVNVTSTHCDDLNPSDLAA
jgi:hypothetical protein